MDNMDRCYYSSQLTVNLDAIGQNIEKIKAYTGGLGIIPVVKSNAYGFGTVAVAKYLVHHCGIRMIATARLFEACQIQDAGCMETELFTLGPLPPYSIPVAVQRGVQIPLFRVEDAKILSEEAKKLGLPCVKTQLKLETGMNRIGVKLGDELAALIRYVKSLGNIVIDGVFTHFSTAAIAQEGAGNDFTREQFALFCAGLEQVRAAGIEPRFIHCCNTGATTWLKEAYAVCTHVRAGSLYLGYSSIQNDWNPIGVEEPAYWRTEIVNIRELHPGESCGYDRVFMPGQDAKVAVIAVGYGDGYNRRLAASSGPVLINGKRCNFVGTCMDMSFVDVTGLDCKVGDEVTLFGEDGKGNRISGLEIGHIMGETRLAMFSHITERVARVYIVDGKAVDVTQI